MKKQMDTFALNRRLKLLEERISRVEDCILEINIHIRDFDVKIRKLQTD